MGDDPAFLFYPNDYLGGTMGFSFEQHGAYLILLIYQFNNGEFHKDIAIKMIGEDLYNSISHKFLEKDGCICNARLMQEITRRKAFSENRRQNAKKGWKKRKNNGICNASAMHMHSTCNDSALHMGNETRDRTRDGTKDKNKDEINKIVEYLNQKCGTSYRAKTKGTVSHIRARISEGFTTDDFYRVIDKKFCDWSSDTKMREYLRPDTLFGSKFESYLNSSKIKSVESKKGLLQEYGLESELDYD